MHQEEHKGALWTKSFISLTLCSFLLFLNLQMLLSSFPAYVKNQFQAGDLQVSLVTSVFAISAILTRFLTAALLKKYSRNVLIFTGLIIAAVTTGIYVFAGSVGTLLIMRAGYGVGFGIASTILPTLVSQIIPLRRMGEGIGYFGLSSSLAMSIGPMIGLNVMKQSGFGTLTIIGTVTVIVILPILILTRSIPRATRINNGEGAAKVVSRENLKGGTSNPISRTPFNRKLLFPALLNMVLSITYSGLLSFIALFGEFVHLEQVGLFFLFNAVTIIIIRPISGRVFDRRGHAAVLIPAALLVVVSMTVLSFAATLPMLVVSALLYGLGFGAIQPTIQAWMLRTSSPEQYGAANSMFYNSTDFGVAIGAIILGAIASATNYAQMYLYSAGFMVLFIVLYLSIYLLSRYKNKGKTEADFPPRL
ncbi:putative MFS family arabinose efflux permease [Fontibacillus phaseoli]|uniref:Putative MFS family arabinose efflux permease n=1 Tax=Fontibacillus phaseoli TaxID=1416533 RepID=A0A369B8P8_9BACL|nr:MFS transporter [Fontibacillus phaseoli]RCX16968.1 putative MFS family arabinose efflux permease [Fontibacillus phaseoli]